MTPGLTPTRRAFLGGAASALPALGSFWQNSPAQPMNVLFILADDLGWADLACYGSNYHETPNLDAFAKSGVRFTNAYASAPVCSPTRAALLTGKSPARLGMTTWHESSASPATNQRLLPAPSEPNLPLTEITLAELYRKAGYHTIHAGKWHLGTAGYYPEAHGFDVNIGGTFWGAPQTFFHPFTGNKRYGGEFRYVPGLDRAKPGDYLVDALADAGLEQLSRNGSRRFFLNYWCHAVHTPMEAPAELVDYYKRKLAPGHTHSNSVYAAMLHRLDANVGRLLQRLKQTGLDRNTIVVFTSDNGGYTEPFDGVPVTNNRPLRSGKGSLYEGGLRVPLLARVPGVTPQGAICDVPFVTTDWYPTLRELNGLPAGNGDLDGRSMAAWLKNPHAAAPQRDLFFHFPHYYPTTTPVSAIRSGAWKLLEYLETGHIELYDLREDPSESTSLASKLPDMVKDLRSRLDAWRKREGARMPKPNPAFDHR